MKFWIFCYCIFLGMFSSCEAENSKAAYSRRVNQVTATVAKDLRERYQMHGFGGGYLKIAFQMRKSLTEEEARLLIMSCLNYYLDTLNSADLSVNEDEAHIFTEEDVDIVIYFEDESGYEPLYPYVSTVGTHPGRITFNYDCPKIKHPFSKTHVETHQEANEKLLGQRKLTTSQNREFQRLAKAVVRQTASQIEGGQLEIEGAGFEGDKFSVRYRLYTPKNHEEARAMVLKAADILVDKINASEALKVYVTKYPFTRENVELAVHFIKAKGALGPDGWVLVPGVDCVVSNGKETTFGFFDNSRHVRHSTTEPYATSLLLLKGADIEDPIAQFILTLD